MAVTNGSDDNATNTGSTGNDGQHRDLLAGRLARLRDQLLDFSNRNRLISFKHSDRARTHIRVIDELPDVLFAKLCDGDKLTFLALPEPETEPPDENTPDFQIEFEAARLTDEEYRQAISRLDPDDVSAPDAERIERDLCDRVREKLGMPPWIDESKLSRADFARQYDLEPTYDLPFPREAGDDPERQLDDEMQTLLFPREMDRKLGGIHDQARTMFQEAGISTLRAAFGFLEWYESEISERAHLAPLLLMPVEMERRRSRPWRKYLLYSESAEVETNKTLAIRLEREFGFDLPEFEDDDTPERYLARVSEAVEPHSRWRVRRFLTVGNFGFSKLAMYNDLDPNTWPKSSSILDHTLVGEMLLGSPQSDGSSFSAPDYDIDTEEIDRKAVCLVLNADASQYSAILDALEGKNLVIKGPPGTGKSQTIANLIAAGLAAGKRILFVAEKMAALDVVYSRLKDVGLTEFCLELHANKGPKTAVLDSLRQRLEVQDQIHLPDTFEAKREELRNLRDQLNEYVSEVNKPVGALGKTFQEILWASQRAQMAAGNIFDAVKNFRLPNVLDLSLVEMSSAIHAIEVAFATRESFGSEFGSGNSHPWGWVGNGNMNPFDVEETQEETRKWHHLLVNLNHALGEIKDSYGLTDISTLNDIEDLIGFLDELPSVPSQTVRWTATALQEGDLRAAGQKFVDLNKLGTTNTGDSSQIDIITNLPPVGRDWSTHANRLIKEIDILLNFSSQIQTLQSAEELSVVKETLLSDADAFLECVRSVQQACGVSESTEKVALVFTITFLEVLHSVSREVLTRRHSMIMDETSGPILVRAAEKSREAESQRNKLEETFVLQPLPPLQEVNRHAAALRGAGRFALFSTEVSEAKKFYRSISSRKKRADTARMASDLTELGINLATVRELAEDSSLREICGQWFMGADTEFGVLLEAQEWGCQVRAKFATTGEISSSMRCLLLDGDIEVLDRLIALIPHEKAVERIRFIFREATDSSNMEHKVASDRAALNTFQLAIANLKSAGIGRNIALQDVRRAIESIRELETFRQALQSTRDDYISGAGDNLLSEVSAEDIRSALEHLTRISESSAPPSVINCLCSPSAETFREKLKEWGQDQRDKIALERSSRERIISLTSLLPLELCQRESVGECEINSIIDRLGFAIERMDTLTQWTDFLRSTGAIDQLGLSELNTKLKETPATAETAKAAYETLVYNALARAAYERCPSLAEFNGLSIEKARSRFRELDREMLDLQRQQLRAGLCGLRIPAGIGHGYKRDFTELSLIQNELAKKRRHIPVRDLVSRAGQAIKQMKPCLMMSPLSIATFLPPGQFSFDLVVMDEASQITPADAIGAIARANQCVIVGDPEQLPPTSFFKRFEDLSEEDDEEEATDTESILDQALGVFRPPRELRWHYRSRHESLIAFSNKHFYNNGLTVFPSWIEDDEHYGVRLVNVDGRYADRHNPIEAKAIAEWAVEFMRSRPNKSMGIVAVNQLQRDLIYDEMERRFGQVGAAEDYRSQWENTLTPFFVKNLENVQGDERDVIAISTVYGPNADGRVLQNFGPISRRNGYRRLNVLFTRARDQVVLFSSLRPENIDIRGTTGRGPRILKNYLDYALTGRLDHGQQTTRPPDSDFEVAVANRLQSYGYEVVAQVGVSGFYIDLAVRHPEFPGIFLLGVECDGATYHSAKSARDRDRLREEVLFGLGWKLYRVWSTDWFRDPQRETEKLCAYIERVADERRVLTKEAVLDIKPSTELEMAADGEDQALKEKPVEVEEWPVGVRDGEKVFAAPSGNAIEFSEDIFSRADEGIDEESDEDIDEELVEIGDSVVFRYLDAPDEPHTFRIVEEDYDPTKGTISPYSPIGSAFIDSAVGEEIELTGGKEARTIIIDSIGKAESKVSVTAPPHTDYSSITEGHENRGLVKEEDEDAQALAQPGVVPNQLPFSSGSGMQITRYQLWQPRTLPDPRSSGRIDRATALKEIIEAEGPIKVKRAYRLYAHACGIRRVGREIRSRLNQALHSLVRVGEVEVGIEGPEEGQVNGVVYLKGTPKVLVRKGGNREFWEIPPSEFAAVLSMKARSSSWSGNEDLYRQVLAHYGIKRLTRNMLTEFDRIYGLLGKN